MRKSILLYLFAFSVIIIITQYVNSNKILKAQNEDIARLMENLEEAESQLDSLQSQATAGVPFSLMSNEDAMSYLESRGFDAAEVAKRVEDEIISRNRASKDNELVPYEGMEGEMRINQVHVLNHKWIIADFTDGKYWGEVFLTYELDDEGNLLLQTEKGLLFPQA